MQVIVTYRRTTRLTMRIGRAGEVRVSAPYGVSRAVVERFVNEHADWIKKTQAKRSEQQQKRIDFFGQLPLSTKKEKTEATQKLNAIIEPLLLKYTAKMGVAPSAITYRATISRWGCCSVKTKAIQFSLYLLLLPDWCIESIVVHELTHLIVPNHSPQFYAIMEKYFPLWREARNEIKRITSTTPQ